MAKPNLQVALDNNTLESALADVRAVGNIVDIVEAGTILILQEGTIAVRALRALFPDKIVIADVLMQGQPLLVTWAMLVQTG